MNAPLENSPELMAALERQVAKDQASGKTLCMVPYPDQEQVKKWDPKALTPKHKQILTLKAQGMKREEIGALCRCTPEFVTMLAQTEKGKAYLKEIEGYMDQELSHLNGKVVEVLRDTLTSGSEEGKLKAAKLTMQATGKLGKRADEAESAEDVIGRIMAMQINGDVNIQINNGR